MSETQPQTAHNTIVVVNKAAAEFGSSLQGEGAKTYHSVVNVIPLPLAHFACALLWLYCTPAGLPCDGVQLLTAFKSFNCRLCR